MSRVIKFRAWDKLRNEWYKASENGGISPYIGFHVFGECTLLCAPRVEDLQHMVIQQFTGLTDCNGVEVYEGDVCCIAKDRRFVSKVCFYMGGFMFADYMGGAVLSFATQNIEVIGNIYEHPHLLDHSSEQP